ncbi:prepilin peptidase [Paractinoplanes deccanensis]|uniref:prepilin peptidase n=1 Tax=Paractinoplanes deccanensis TaxID=113561 RepID=UPI0034DAD7BF
MSGWRAVGPSVLTGVVAASVCARLPLSLVLPAFWLFAVGATALAIIDVRTFRLPHVLSGALAATFGVAMIAESLARQDGDSLITACAAGSGAFLLMLAVALILPGQLGLGDVSLAGVIAMSLGWIDLAMAARGLLIGTTIQALLAGVAFAIYAGDRRRRIAFGPALLTGWVAAVLLQGAPDW